MTPDSGSIQYFKGWGLFFWLALVIVIAAGLALDANHTRDRYHSLSVAYSDVSSANDSLKADNARLTTDYNSLMDKYNSLAAQHNTLRTNALALQKECQKLATSEGAVAKVGADVIHALLMGLIPGL